MLLLLVFLAPALAFAQPDAAPLVVMNLAAHPDDEDGATLAYYRHARDAVAYSLIFTRGEGGQNEIGPELYEALGALRTQETERAARVLGTQVLYLNYPDFGYSKFAHETFERWGGRDAVTARLVRLIRELKPDVLFTNHDTVTVGATQHGHHQAVGIAAYDAFALAADPDYRPDQLEEPGVDLWQPKRLFLRRWRATSGGDVLVPVGDYGEEVGQSYAELAAAALDEHASQGMDRFAQWLRARDQNAFVLLRSAGDAPLHPTDLAGNLPPNTAARPRLDYWIDSGRIASLPDEAYSLADSVVVPGQRVQLSWHPDLLPGRRVQWRLSGTVDTTLFITEDTPGIATLYIPDDAAPHVPEAVYQYDRFRSSPPVRYGVYQAGSGELLAAGYLPLRVAPPVLVEVETEVARLRSGANRLPVRVDVFDPEVTRVDLTVAVSSDASREVVYQRQRDYQAAEPGIRDTLSLMMPADLPTGDYTVTLTALPSPTTTGRRAAHDHAAARVFHVDVPEGLRVGVIESYDNTLDRVLEELEVQHVMLDSLMLAEGDLDDLHTIVVDIRAYLVRRDLRTHNDRLLEWVRRGGHLVVNYQKVFEWNRDHSDPFLEGERNPAGFAPYPLQLGRGRVTYEDAPVELLVPGHLLFRKPNLITDDAWTGWVQERGLYFPQSYSDHYVELLSTADPGESPRRESTLLASYGEGTYLYTALVWYRQLKMNHPGAYAIFANMISLPLVDAQPR